MASFDLWCVKLSSSRTSRMPTISRFSFGTSMPTRPSPGIGAWIRIDFAFRVRVRSFFSASIFASRTHSLGRRRYWMTVGPTHSPSISTSIPNWRNVFSIMRDFSSISSGETRFLCTISFRSFALGKSHVPKSSACCLCLLSMIFPSGVSIGIFLLARLESAELRRLFPFGSSFLSSHFRCFCRVSRRRSRSSDFFL